VQDFIVSMLGCDGAAGCGYGPDYNYGIAVGVPVRDDTAVYTPSPSPNHGPASSPSPTTPIYVYACDRAGICNQYQVGHPALMSCPRTFPQPDCNDQCSNHANWCSG
jgi:hypothetical protein